MTTPKEPPKLNLTSHNITEDKLRALKDLLPEVFTEGNIIDWDKLRLTLGETLENEDPKERFGLTWPGKRNCFQAIQSPTHSTLLPDRETSVDFDTTENVYIEGDNLEVLKLLQKSYLGKIKMIYIDPPYNTGNDFVYPDDYTETLKTYLEYTGQVDAEGRKFSNNTDTTGRFHTKWLNMMYPRLRLAHNLLREDGVIFISIDDREVAHLRKICDEIFGEENFISNLIWKRRVSSALAEKNISNDHDYVLVYQKSNFFEFIGFKKTFENYKNPDNDPRGPWIADNLTVGMNASMRPNQAYDLVDPATGNVYAYNPNRVWAFIPETMNRLITEGRILFPSDPSKRPMQKRFKNELKSDMDPFSSMIQERVGLNSEATRLLQELFGLNLFDYSKPLSLLSLIFSQTSSSDIILDFFSGSATTAHAVLALNKEDGGNRKFICVQLPEPTRTQKADGTWEESEASKAGYKTISEIGIARIKKVIAKMKEEGSGDGELNFQTPARKRGRAAQGMAPTLGLEGDNTLHLTPNGGGETERSPKEQDLGFRVFRLAPSQFPIWNGHVEKTAEAVSKALKADEPEFIFNNPLSGTPEAILFEVLLKTGIERALANHEIKEETIVDQKVYIVYGTAYYILGEEHSEEVFREIAKRNPSRVIASEKGFGGRDVLKANVHAQFKQMKVPFQVV